MARSYLLWGSAGTGKSNFGLEDASEESPVSYHEWEPGGFRRAATRLGFNEDNLPPFIRLHKYRVPVQELESLGEIQVTRNGNVLPQLKYKLDGWTVLLAEFNQTYMQDCKDGFRPITDTCTRLWLCQQQTWEQQVQEATNGGDSAKLDRLKYTTPNSRMTGAMEFAGAYNLDAIFIAHEKPVYNSDPPITTPDAWRETEGLVDLCLRFAIKGRLPVARITKGAEFGMLLQGLEIPEPSLSKLNTIMSVVAALASENEEVPLDTDTLLNLGKMRGL